MKLAVGFNRGAALLAAMGLLLAGVANAKNREPEASAGDQRRQLVVEKNGTYLTRPGLTLRVFLDRGDVVIHTQNTPRVNYSLRVETPQGTTLAPGLGNLFDVAMKNTANGIFLRGQVPANDLWRMGVVWVTLDVTVPKSYSLDISTEGGNIQVADMQGRVNLLTAGGNISTANIRGSAHVQTGGGHITLKDVSGNLEATTGGGHVTTGKIGGSANIHSYGGHIRVAAAAHGAWLQTGGGNISLGNSGMDLVAETGGGQIEVGEAKGAIRARTGGGGIRVVSSKGPTQLQTDSGSIYLTRVDSAVRAQTGEGGITAWLTPNAHLEKPCILESGQGDIVVYLPADLRLTIVATAQGSDERRIFVDPGLAVKVSTDSGPGGVREVRGSGALNGGGELLRLRTMEGNIRLLLNDASHQADLYKQQMDELHKQLEKQLKAAQNTDSGQP